MANSTAEQVSEFLRSPNNRCFVCGSSNPHGLHIHLRWEGEMVATDFVPTEWHEGWSRITHGGILSALLDEVMAYTLLFQGYEAVTARLELRFRQAVRQGEQLRVEAKVVDQRRTMADIEGRILRADEVVVEGKGRFMILGRLRLEV